MTVRRRTLLAGAGAAGFGLLGGCDAGGAEATGTLRITTGGTGAVYYKYGTAIAELAKRYLPKVHVSVMPSAASADNVQYVLTGVADLGFTQADTVKTGAETAPGQLAAIARLYDDYVHLVVSASGPIDSVEALAGRRVSVGERGSGTAPTVNRFLSVAGATPEQSLPVEKRELSLAASVEALRTGTIDAFFFCGGLPVTLIAGLAKEYPIRLINLAAYVQRLRDKYGNYYAERVVPASTYAGITATVSIGIANYLIVRVSMPEPLAYGVTRLLFDGRDELAKAHQAAGRLNIRSAISTPPLPLHPGSIRYYREQKA